MGATRIRQVVCEALKVAAPAGFSDAMRRAYLDDGVDVGLAALGLDSLGHMELCIAIELNTGVTLLPAELAGFASAHAIEEWLATRLSPAAERAR